MTARLLTSESNFRSFFETIEDLIIVASREGTLLYTNEVAAQVLGYRTEELQGTHALALHPASTHEEAIAQFHEMILGTRTQSTLPLLCKDGRQLSVDTRMCLGRWDGKDCLFAISKDLSKALESQNKFDHIFQHNPALMAISSLPDRILLDVNEMLLDTLGYTKEEILDSKTSIGLEYWCNQ